MQAVSDWPTPAISLQLKSFLWLASYYRRFVQDFSTITGLLFHLLSFPWTEGCQNSFAVLKQALAIAPILAPPDPALPFILDMDASSVGMVAVLSQVGTGGEWVMAYYSKAFNKFTVLF